MKILFVSSDKFPPYRVDVSVLFARELVSRGNKIDWLLQSDSKCNKAFRTKWSGGNAWVGPTELSPSAIGRFRKHFMSVIHDLKMLIITKNNHYDFVFVKDKFIASLFAILVSKLFKIKFIFWLSWPYPEAALHKAKEGISNYVLFDYIRGWSFHFMLYRIIIPTACHVFVQSEQMKLDIMEFGISPLKLTPVPMGVALDQFPVISNALASAPLNVRAILYLGDMGRNRKIDFLLRVLVKVKDSYPDILLYMVGSSHDPSDIVNLKEIAKKLQIENLVIFTGFLPLVEAQKYMLKCSVCVSPFYPAKIFNSTSPTKLVEYMAMSKPVVANDHPEQRIVIEESGGGICVPYDESMFANAITKLLESPELAVEMGRKGRKYIETRRSYRVIAQEVESKLLELNASG